MECEDFVRPREGYVPTWTMCNFDSHLNTLEYTKKGDLIGEPRELYQRYNGRLQG